MTSLTAGGTTFSYTAAAGVANPNVATSGGTAVTAATVLVTGELASCRLCTAAQPRSITTNATTTATVGDLITAINSNANGAFVGTGGGANGTITTAAAGPAGSLHAALVGGQLQITDTVGNNNLAVTGEASIIAAATTNALPRPRLRRCRT